MIWMSLKRGWGGGGAANGCIFCFPFLLLLLGGGKEGRGGGEGGGLGERRGGRGRAGGGGRGGGGESACEGGGGFGRGAGWSAVCVSSALKRNKGTHGGSSQAGFSVSLREFCLSTAPTVSLTRNSC